MEFLGRIRVLYFIPEPALLLFFHKWVYIVHEICQSLENSKINSKKKLLINDSISNLVLTVCL